MRTTIVASICLAAVMPALKADLIVKEKVEGDLFGPTPQEITVKVKGTKCRADATGQKVTIIDSATGTTPSQRSTIIDTATGTMTILLHPRKAYVKISLEQVGETAEALKILTGKKGQDATQAEFQPTGKKETINGYETEEYTVSVNGVPTTVALAPNFPNYQEVLRALSNVKSGPGLDVYSRLSVPPEKYPGMPIRTVSDFMGLKTTTTLESVEETNLADSVFTIPVDYKEVSQESLQNKDNSEDESQ